MQMLHSSNEPGNHCALAASGYIHSNDDADGADMVTPTSAAAGHRQKDKPMAFTDEIHGFETGLVRTMRAQYEMQRRMARITHRRKTER